MRVFILSCLIASLCLTGCNNKVAKDVSSDDKSAASTEGDLSTSDAIDDSSSSVEEPELADQETKMAAPSDFEFNHPIFEAPQIVMAEGEPLAANIMYPSPVIFDVDNDGDTEMVIGSIFGGLYASENSNEKGGEPVWENYQPVNETSGKPLELNNW